MVGFAPRGLRGDSPLQRFESAERRGWLPRGWIDGLVLSNDGTDATNDIAISAGACRSTVSIVNGEVSTLAQDQIDIDLPVSIIKQLDVSWGPENYDPAGYSGGGRSGMLAPGSSIGNDTWHIYAVGGADKQPDILAVDSVTQADILAEVYKIGYTAYRRIGSILRASGAIRAFHQHGNLFLLSAAVSDYSGESISTTAGLLTLTVPTGVNVVALIRTESPSSSGESCYLSSPSVTDAASSIGTTANVVATSAGSRHLYELRILTNTSAQIRARASATIILDVATYGWEDPRTA
jgi:hypothetical protein